MSEMVSNTIRRVIAQYHDAYSVGRLVPCASFGGASARRTPGAVQQQIECPFGSCRRDQSELIREITSVSLTASLEDDGAGLNSMRAVRIRQAPARLSAQTGWNTPSLPAAKPA